MESNWTFYTFFRIENNGNFQDQYSCPCQDPMVPARCMGYTRLMSKTNVTSSFQVSLTSKEHTEKHGAARMFHSLRDCMDLSRTRRHTVPQEPWTLPEAYEACLSRHLGYNNATAPSVTPPHLYSQLSLSITLQFSSCSY